MHNFEWSILKSVMSQKMTKLYLCRNQRGIACKTLCICCLKQFYCTRALTFVDCSQIFVQSRFPWSGLFTTFPWQSNPRMSFPTLLVRPDSSSCLWRKSFWRARPRPLSRPPWVSTPNRVLFPASTFPTTATLQRKQNNRFINQILSAQHVNATFMEINWSFFLMLALLEVRSDPFPNWQALPYLTSMKSLSSVLCRMRYSTTTPSCSVRRLSSTYSASIVSARLCNVAMDASKSSGCSPGASPSEWIRNKMQIH